MSKQTRRPPYKTDAPQLSEATIARIRTAARQYVRAGGSIYPNPRGDDRDEHIGNVDCELHDGESGAAFSELLSATVKDFETRERLHNTAWSAVTAHADAGFLFGAFVGLEVAALTVGPVATMPTTRTPRTRKGGAR